MPNSKFGVTLDNVWADYRRCARRSRALKAKLDGVRMSALVLVTLSGVLGLLSTQLPESLNPARICLPLFQKCGETLEVLRRCFVTDIDVVRHAPRSVRGCGKSFDHHELYA